MFSNCKNVINIDLSFFEYTKITNMSCMFHICSSLKSLPNISKWDTKNVTDMSYMFYNCSSLQSLPEFYKRYNEY